MNIKKITANDLKKAYDYVTLEPTGTWYKKLYEFDDGSELCFTAGMSDGYDDGERPVVELGILPRNSGMTEFGYDFIIPWDSDGNVFDTGSELDLGDKYLLDWFNEQAAEIVKGMESGELAITSGCHKKGKGKKTIKSMAAVSRSEFMDDGNLARQATEMFKDSGIETIYPASASNANNEAIRVSNFGIVEIGADDGGRFDKTHGKYFIDVYARDNDRNFKLIDDTYFEGVSVQEFRKDIETLIAQIKSVRNEKKTIKSAMDSRSLGDFSNDIIVRILEVESYDDRSPSVYDFFSEGDEMDLAEFKRSCKDLAEGQNGYFQVDDSSNYYRQIVNFISYDDEENMTGSVTFEVVLGLRNDALDDYLVASSKKPLKSMARQYMKPQYDARKSFYNKAETDDDKLYSYGTLVAEIVDGEPVLHDKWDFSATTIRHVKEWLQQNGFEAGTKQEIGRKYKRAEN